MLKSLYKRILSERKRISIIQFSYKIRASWYSGEDYSCNCCGRSFRLFLPKGNILRLNAQCPYCGSLERTRLLLMYLKNETDYLSQRLKVLHIAPEKCLFDLFRKLDWEYIDGDINPNLATYQLDLTSVSYPDRYFDLVICSHVLGHIPDEPRAVRELYRILKPDGAALVLTLLDRKRTKTLEDSSLTTEAERLQAYGERDLCRLHGADFKERLAAGGLHVSEIDYRTALGLEVNQRYSLGNGERELIFLCKRGS